MGIRTQFLNFGFTFTTVVGTVIGIVIGIGNIARADIDNLKPTSVSPFTSAENWASDSKTHSFTLTGGKTFTIENPELNPEMDLSLRRFSTMKTFDQIEFRNKRRDALVGIARVLSSGKVVPDKWSSSALEFFDARLIESAEAVVNAKDFGISLTANAGAGLAVNSRISKSIGKKLSEKIGQNSNPSASLRAMSKLVERGGFLYSGGIGINIGFLSSENSAYIEVVADGEKLYAVQTALAQVNHTYRALMYFRSSNHPVMFPVEKGHKVDSPIPLMTGMTTDRGIYLGLAYGPSLLWFLDPLWKNIILPGVDQSASFTTQIKRLHLLRITGSLAQDQKGFTIQLPIIEHPVFDSSKELIAKVIEVKERAAVHVSRARNKLYDIWPETPSCIQTLGLVTYSNSARN